jgi:hypothetical protein
MFLKRVFSAAAVVAFVSAAPAKLQRRQAPAGVPDYVLKYGKNFTPLVFTRRFSSGAVPPPMIFFKFLKNYHFHQYPTMIRTRRNIILPIPTG